GGGSVRTPRLIVISRMMDMMLTGHVLTDEEGQALSLSHYLVEPGEGLAKGIELATRIAGNAFLTNFAVMHALPRIAEQDRASGYIMEGLMAAIAGGGEEAKARVKAFLDKRGPNVAGGRHDATRAPSRSGGGIRATGAARPARFHPRSQG